MKTRLLFVAVLLWFVFSMTVGAESPTPNKWQQDWNNPPASDRPLQITHGIGASLPLPEGMPQVTNTQGPDAFLVEQLSRYKECGLGGVVCNVAFQNYMQSEENWKTLSTAIEALAKLGLTAWIYDENGYPSGSAGGLVLKDNRDYEAVELTYDPSRSDPFQLRRAYEFTHASNNYAAARRYINLIDDRAVRCFLAKTHEAYRQRLGSAFGTTIQAMFTDEPSLMAVNLGQIPEEARKKVPVADPLDPAVKPLPAVPWCYDLPTKFQERYRRDLMPLRRSLFTGNTPEDRETRRQFWAIIAELTAERYFGAIQQWCAGNHLASSGHTLCEESPLHHVPLEGNGLKMLGRMDIPGLDVLTSDPEAVIYSGWLTAGLPASAAVLNGRRRVMTEVSDFCETQGGRGPAPLADMQATAAWQAAWGVTEFTLYYSPSQRRTEQYRAYCDFVGRLNAILKPADLAPEVLLYYPVYDLWAEYLPTAERLQLESQSPKAQELVRSFMQLGQSLQRQQIPFTLIDHENLAVAKVDAKGNLVIHGHAFRAIVLPQGVALPAEAAGVVEQFRQHQGRVLAGPWDNAKLQGAALVEALQPPCRVAPECPTIALGQFVREGRTILLVVNVGRQPYEGTLTVRQAGQWRVFCPADGAAGDAKMAANNQIRLTLTPRQTLLFVQDAP